MSVIGKYLCVLKNYMRPLGVVEEAFYSERNMKWDGEIKHKMQLIEHIFGEVIHGLFG